MPTPAENSTKLLSLISEKYLSNEINDECLVSISILCFDYLQLKTISQFATDNKKTYRGVKNHNKNIIAINQHLFVKDNL